MELKDTDFMKVRGERQPRRAYGDPFSLKSPSASHERLVPTESEPPPPAVLITIPELQDVLQTTLRSCFQEQEKSIARLLESRSPPPLAVSRQGTPVAMAATAEKFMPHMAMDKDPSSPSSLYVLQDWGVPAAAAAAPVPRNGKEKERDHAGHQSSTDGSHVEDSMSMVSPKLPLPSKSPESSIQPDGAASSWKLSKKRTKPVQKTKMSATWQVVLEDRAELSRVGESSRDVLGGTRFQDMLLRWTEQALAAEEPERDGCLSTAVNSRLFDFLCGIVIIANASLTCWATDQEVRYLDSPPQSVEDFIFFGDLFFLVFYTLELALKLVVHRWFFFWNEDSAWNMLDLALVVMAAYDMLLTVFLKDTESVNFVFIRTVRIFKLAKILRVIRVMRFFSELRLMVNSLAGSFSSLFWSFVMLAFIFYIFGLMFVQGVATYLADEPDISEQEREELLRYFGRVSLAMLSLFEAATGGEDWDIFYTPMKRTGVFNSCLYIFFIGFIQIALLNILTGIFVESAMKLAQPDRETLALEQRKREIIEADEMTRLCEEMDMDQSGTINAAEVGAVLRSRRMRAHLAVLGLEIRDAEMFFGMLASATENHEVDIHSFVSGCMRMKGNATSLDLQGLGFQTAMLQKIAKHHYEDLLMRLNHVSAALGVDLPPPRPVAAHHHHQHHGQTLEHHDHRKEEEDL
eukprot:CAMPEP_0178388306 /NCGR_PEP_ID=MMETSP0689_2-20121128/9521_1 /TAXON_ID=160604 /ORGANISM="Amphidinium massartii, Strain CS-259" /LENGTH=688 /DNA_ID=CAMNT_0020008697 /DNA_START=139 /DNA_END=2201 /DNA_ORIENTATION=-